MDLATAQGGRCTVIGWQRSGASVQLHVWPIALLAVGVDQVRPTRVLMLENQNPGARLRDEGGGCAFCGWQVADGGAGMDGAGNQVWGLSEPNPQVRRAALQWEPGVGGTCTHETDGQQQVNKMRVRCCVL